MLNAVMKSFPSGSFLQASRVQLCLIFKVILLFMPWKDLKMGVPLWPSRLRIQYCHCSSLVWSLAGLIPSLATSTYCGCCHKKKKKDLKTNSPRFRDDITAPLKGDDTHCILYPREQGALCSHPCSPNWVENLLKASSQLVGTSGYSREGHHALLYIEKGRAHCIKHGTYIF